MSDLILEHRQAHRQKQTLAIHTLDTSYYSDNAGVTMVTTVVTPVTFHTVTTAAVSSSI